MVVVRGKAKLLEDYHGKVFYADFLDFAAIRTGTWDASLAFVMAGAIAVTFIGFKFALKRSQPLFGEKFHLPAREDIDARVVGGDPLEVDVQLGLSPDELQAIFRDTLSRQLAPSRNYKARIQDIIAAIDTLERNPMIGYRGCYRYLKDPDVFRLELEVLAQRAVRSCPERAISYLTKDVS